MIEVLQVCKYFNQRRKQKSSDPRNMGGYYKALDDITFDANNGQCLALLGANGAGKTTLMRVMSTALKPTYGMVLVDNINAVEEPLKYRRMIGFLSGNTGLYGRLSPREFVSYFGRMHGMERELLNRKIAEWFEKLEISPFADKRCDLLSTGMKQKVNIARTLIHDPKVVIFDEPTTGLDVKAAEQILQVVEEQKAVGHTVVLSTHHMHEVERLADQVVLLHQGRVVLVDTVQGMRDRAGCQQLDKAFLRLIDGETNHAS
jgi:sodium transport system ATP-binding protein